MASFKPSQNFKDSKNATFISNNDEEVGEDNNPQ